jgi:hypothetical protein
MQVHSYRRVCAPVTAQPDGMNKLSQLSVSVSFTLRVTRLDLFPYMLPKVSMQSIGHASLVLRLA